MNESTNYIEIKNMMIEEFENRNLARPPPYSIEQIKQFEDANSITLPKQLRYYLTEISSVLIGPIIQFF